MAGTRNLVKNKWRKGGGGYVQEHVAVVEEVLGRRLPAGAEVHHVDLDPTNNRKDNLVVCPSHAYHMLLHQRTRALKECGNANFLRCFLCGKYNAPSDIQYAKDGKFRWCKGGGCAARKRENGN